MTTLSSEQALKDEIASLKFQLSAANAQLSKTPTSDSLPSHALLLLTDSALPLGSFAFSSGLESYLAHHPRLTTNPSSSAATLPLYLSLSLHSLASTTLPYLTAAYNCPSKLRALDAELDACTLCPVSKRASVAQGRALLTLWERALRHPGSGPLSSSSSPSSATNTLSSLAASKALSDFSTAMKTQNQTQNRYPSSSPSSLSSDDDHELLTPQAHYPLIYALVALFLDLSLPAAQYTYLFSHAKAVVSAGVRASVTGGPYAAQALLGSGWLKGEIEGAIAREGTGGEGGRGVEEAAQSVVLVDVWVGRHELLYSRIFNS